MAQKKNEINIEAICESLVTGKVLSKKTFSGKEHKFEIPKVEPMNADLIQELEIHIDEKTKGKKKIGLALSGGKDSRVLLSILLKRGIKPECVTWSYLETDPEVQIAKKIAKKNDLTHKFVKISPKLYFNPKNEEVLLKLADGNPLYFDMMLWYGIKDQLNHDVLFCGNLMTEYMDTAEYRIYEGKRIPHALLNKETLLHLVSKRHLDRVLNDLIKFYFEVPEEQIIVNRMLDRITQYHIMKKFINWDYPMLNENVLNALFYVSPKERMGSRLTRNILKEINPDLYKMPTGRSPFSLRYPLIMHQAYQKATKRKISKGLEHLLPKSMHEFDQKIYQSLSQKDFINNKNLQELLQRDNRDYRIGFARLINVVKWEEICQKS